MGRALGMGRAFPADTGALAAAIGHGVGSPGRDIALNDAASLDLLPRFLNSAGVGRRDPGLESEMAPGPPESHSQVEKSVCRPADDPLRW